MPMTPLRRYCHNCIHWKWEPTIHLEDGTSRYPGHCGLFSGRCINAVHDGRPEPPPDFQQLELTDETIKEESA